MDEQPWERVRPPATWRLAALALIGLAAWVPGQSPAGGKPAPGFQIVRLDHPLGTPAARFGGDVTGVDVFGQGRDELVVGAPGEGAVYVFLGFTGAPGGLPFAAWVPLQADGWKPGPPQAAGDGFGTALAAGQLDGDLPEELVVGAPLAQPMGQPEAGAVYLFGGTGGLTPTVLTTQDGGGRMGSSLALGDLNGDGYLDLAAGAPLGHLGGKAVGRVHLFFGPFDGLVTHQVLDNPEPVWGGGFGSHLAVDDSDRDGQDDLFVSALGNSASGLIAAGQVYRYGGPVTASSFQRLPDPFPNPADVPGPRYGMDLDARGGLVAVGAPRKDWMGVKDAGLGFLFSGASLALASLHEHPTPQPNDVLGFRVLLADVTGDPRLDAVFAPLPSPHGAFPNPRALLVWDGGAPGHGAREVRLPAGSEDHFAEGLGAAQILPGGHEELLVGDPSFDAPGAGKADDRGRVVLYLPEVDPAGGMGTRVSP